MPKREGSFLVGNAKKIRILLIKKDMTISELAKKINMGQSTLSKKLKKDDFAESELNLIAKALDAKYISYFETEDGERI